MNTNTVAIELYLGILALCLGLAEALLASRYLRLRSLGRALKISSLLFTGIAATIAGIIRTLLGSHEQTWVFMTYGGFATWLTLLIVTAGALTFLDKRGILSPVDG